MFCNYLIARGKKLKLRLAGHYALGLPPPRMSMASSWHPGLCKHEQFLTPKVLLTEQRPQSFCRYSQLARDQNAPYPLTSRTGYRTTQAQGTAGVLNSHAASGNFSECNRILQQRLTHCRHPRFSTMANQAARAQEIPLGLLAHI